MSAPGVSTVVDVARRLREALEQVAEALRTPGVEPLLAAEAALAAAVSFQAPVDAVSGAEAVEAARELADARRALLRCRRLGRSLTELARATALGCGAVQGYGRDGHERVGATRGALEASA
jgi:signal transduction histidine kinase